MDHVTKQLSERGIPYRQDVSLRAYSYFHTGGILGLLLSPQNRDQLIECIKILGKGEITYKVIGETSNLLFLDDTDYTCCITTRHLSQIEHRQSDQRLVVETGAMLPDAARYALAEGIDGFAGLEGIPGTIGGAVFMNAGAFGFSIARVLDSVEVILPDGQLETLPVSALSLQYRNSIFKKGDHPGIIVTAIFHARPGNPETIYRKMETFHAKRHKYNEYMYPNLGSAYSGSIYRALAKRDRFYGIVSSLYLFLNYKFRIFRRESPINRKWINDFTVKRFGIRFGKQPFSDKTMNTLINNGHHTDEHLAYLQQIENLIGSSVPIENEIVKPY